MWGQMTVGGGFNLLQESLSVLGIPTMTKQFFIIDTERAIGKWWWTALEQSMLAAGKEEKQSNKTRTLL